METQTSQSSVQTQDSLEKEPRDPTDGEMPCPICGYPMPDLKGGKATICPVCGFKDSCCY